MVQKLRLTEEQQRIIEFYDYVATVLRQYSPTIVGAYTTRLNRKVPSLNIYSAITFGGYVIHLKIYGKLVNKEVVPVLGLSHRVLSHGGVIYYPTIDADGDVVPPRELLNKALVVWKYEKDGLTKYHVVLPPVVSRSKAIALVRKYNDNKHLRYMAKDWIGWGVLRVSGWGSERVLEARFDSNDPIAVLNRKLRSIFWARV